MLSYSLVGSATGESDEILLASSDAAPIASIAAIDDIGDPSVNVESCGVPATDPLQPGEIRVLDIEPARDNNEIVHYRLHQLFLPGGLEFIREAAAPWKHHPALEPYITVSYAWGETRDDGSHLTHIIICNGLPLRVTANLCGALQALRHVAPVDVRQRRDPVYRINGNDVETVRWSFPDHPSSAKQLRDADRLLLDVIEQSDPPRRVFVVQKASAAEGWAWRESAMATFETHVQEFLQRLCVLIHVSSGQPVREPEFSSMMWRNTQR
ncbi:hypothetical protein LTR12_016831 [Friedmanniomyces endolithicus]|nr:hypothetical protein LTR12_016831 [Friedmanniomyces endolithicus]